MTSLSDKIKNDANAVSGAIDSLSPFSSANQSRSFENEGFSVPAIPSGDGAGLPSYKIPAEQKSRPVRKMVHWFVPEFGVIKMYVNPNSIRYQSKKAINKERTKGGFILQYWGEELETLQIGGTTGSSGVEGINVLYEVYRAEQIAFDAIGLTLAANSSVNETSNFIDNAFNSTVGGDTGNALGSLTKGLLGIDPASQQMLPKNIPSLASLAFGVEMFYQGWVFRGFFEDFNVTESADKIGLFDYTFNFTVTQRRGYRTNFMPWHRSAISGPSNNGLGGTPFSLK